MKILIVEDDEGSRIYLERALMSQGYSVESAANGVKALERVEQAPPDLVISDIMMPEMDGFELCRKLKTDERFHAIPFVFYTATYIEKKDEQLALALGASRYLVKPMELDDLSREIRAVFDELRGRSLESPIHPLDEIRELDRMQLEVLARKLDKKVRELGEEHEALRRSESRYHKLLDSMMDGFAYVDMNDRIREYNSAFRMMLGYDDEELKSLTTRAITPEKWYDFELKLFNEQILKRGFTDIYNKEYRKKDGSVFPVELHTFLIKNDQGENEGMWVIVRDITERKKIEEEKKKLEDQLLQAQKMEAIGTLAGGIAHDFNNILNVIMGYGGILMDKMESDSSSREQMSEILAAAERAANLTRQLLIFSRKQAVVAKAVDANEIIIGVQKMLSRVVGEDIDLNVNLADRRLTVLADTGQIEQVLMNLVANARDAMPDGGHLTISTETKELDDAYAAIYNYGKPGTYAIINVSDTGMGMDVETQAKIFEPFFTTKEIGKGTGLGLAISFGIVKQHKGHLTCYSEPGSGTVFRIYLPMIDDIAASDIKAETAGAVQGGSETILLAEDDISLRELDMKVLASSGYSVITAADGEEAVEKFVENRDRIKLALLDMIMPKKSGMEAYTEIRKNRPGIKVLFMSGYAKDMISRMGAEEDMEILTKPFVPSALLRKVREVLDRNQV
jgi:two-component system, cell cycle sensor histidine kinase and response regulator CckA